MAPTSATCAARRVLAGPLRLARGGGAAQRLSAVQGAAARHRPAFPPRPGQGPGPAARCCSRMAGRARCFEFLELIPRLTDPARFGGDPADAFTVVAPSLPGYGLSFAPGPAALRRRGDRRLLRRPDDRRARLPRASPRRAATGARSSPSRLGYAHADRLIGIHLNLHAGPARPGDGRRPDARGARASSTSSRSC